MLAVVEHQQRRAVAQRRDQPVGGVLRFALPERGVPQAQRGQHRADDVRGPVRRQLGEGDRARLGRRDLDGQACLAGTAGPGERHEPGARQQVRDLPQLVVTADEAGQLRGQRRDRRLLGFAAKHREVRFGDFRAGVGAQLVGQGAAGVLERGQRVGGPARGVQRPDELRARPFPQGPLGDGLAQAGEDVFGLAQSQPGLDVVVGRLGPQLVEPGGLGGGERRVRQVAERGSAPQRQGLAQDVCGGRAGLQQRAAFACEPLEAVDVHFVRFDDQAVARGGELDRRQVLQRRPQP